MQSTLCVATCLTDASVEQILIDFQSESQIKTTFSLPFLAAGAPSCLPCLPPAIAIIHWQSGIARKHYFGFLSAPHGEPVWWMGATCTPVNVLLISDDLVICRPVFAVIIFLTYLWQLHHIFSLFFSRLVFTFCSYLNFSPLIHLSLPLLQTSLCLAHPHCQNDN